MGFVSGAVVGAAAGAAAAYYYIVVFKKASGFIGKVVEAEEAIGKANILPPDEAKKLIEATPGALLLDVQDPGSDMIKGSHSASLGTLPFKASTDLADFKDPAIADRPKDALIIVNCGLGGQAKLGAKLLVDLATDDDAPARVLDGFTNVKTIDGGCLAYNKVFPPKADCCGEKKG